MKHLSDDDRRRAFAVWLRTGRLSPKDRLELKFNPWHDPANGRFTFAGSGRHFSSGAVNHTVSGKRTSGTAKRRDPAEPPTGARPALTTQRAERLAVENRPLVNRPQQHRVTASIPRITDRPNPAFEFARGAAEGVSETAVGAVRGTYSLLTTNPITTVRDAGRVVAGTIDAAITAEDVPARIQISRAAHSVAYASAHDLGAAVGSTAADAALAIAPGATLSKVSALRRLRTAGPSGVIYDRLQVGWVKENLVRDGPAKLYNDAATGARPSHAPTLMRTMPDGSKRPVKFDGIQGEYVIDRKWKVVDAPRARAQLLRQSEVLAQHSLVGIWEVPTATQKSKAYKLLKKVNVANIKIRVVKP